jgi:hypothetical protein
VGVSQGCRQPTRCIAFRRRSPRRAGGQTASKPLGANGTLTGQLTKVPAGATAVHIHNALGSVDVVAGLESYYG